MKRLLVVLVVLAGFLLVADRVAAYATARVLAGRLQTQQHLANRPDVAIRGFPFLTQVAAGHYDEVDVTAAGVVAGDLRLDRLRLQAYGIQVGLSDLVHGTVTRVPVRRATATVDVSFADLDTAVARQAGSGVVRPPTFGSSSAGRLSVTAGISVLGATVSATGEAAVSITAPNEVAILPFPGSFAGLPSAVRGPVSRALTYHLHLPGLPFGAALTSGRVSPAGVRLGATATGLVLPVR